MLFNSHILRWFSYVVKEHQLTEYCRAITGCVSRRAEDVINDKNDVSWRVWHEVWATTASSNIVLYHSNGFNNGFIIANH